MKTKKFAAIGKALTYFHLLLLLTACSLVEIKEQTNILNSLGEITGEITVTLENGHNLNAILLTKENGFLKVGNQYSVGADGRYVFPVVPGTYYIAAYVDSNNDEEFQLTEPASYLGITSQIPQEINVSAGEKINIENIRIEGIIKHIAAKDVIQDSPLIIKNIGRVVSIDDSMFDRSNASIGLWRPVDFIEKIGGGLFFLQAYDESKIPVLFIHGINGTALDWETTIASIDREKFQPWVLYYPSGVGLNQVSDYLIKSINTLQNRYKIDQLYVIAHSMGGLVARSFIMKHTEGKSTVKIALAMTVNSPLNGMASAKSGIKYSPIVAPSWHDVAMDSAFIKKINAWDMPADIPYHLIFSFESGEGDDGVVSLESQLPMKLQAEAVKIYGFNSGHASVLREDNFIILFNTILKQSLHNP